MSSYEVIVNEYFGMPMDPLDPYAQLVIEAPPLPDYISGPEALPSSDYIPGPEYPEYLPPADDVFPAEEQLLPTAVSPTVESPGYITDLKPEMDPEEEDGDNENSISASEDSNQTEPFEEGETATTPPISAYLLPTSYPLPPFLMPLPIFTPLPPPPPIILPRTRASMVLMRSTTPSIFILAPRSRAPPIGTPPLLPIPLPTSSFPLPLLLPSTSGSESIPEADMPLQKRARCTTPTSGYEVGESSVAAAARQIRPALTIDDSHRAEDRLIGRLRREGRYFFTLSITYARGGLREQNLCPASATAQRKIRRMFPKESDEIERYVGGLHEMIRGNVMSYEPKSMQKAIESTNDQMDQQLLGISDRQAKNKRKFDNTSRNQQNQKPFKRNNNVARAYAAGSGEKKPYGGTKPLCPKCNFHHDGPCRPKCTNCKRTGHIA
nr:hypothetical protein [Tanacetum cinerariifolium]